MAVEVSKQCKKLDCEAMKKQRTMKNMKFDLLLAKKMEGDVKRNVNAMHCCSMSKGERMAKTFTKVTMTLEGLTHKNTKLEWVKDNMQITVIGFG